MLITQAEAARRLKISREAVRLWTKENNIPGFFIKHNDRYKIDDEHPEFIHKLEKSKINENKRLKHNKKIGESVKKKRMEKMKKLK